MNLSRPDRRERLDRLAAEFALGTSTSRVRRRLSAIATRDRVVADALTEWERRLAVLADAVPPVTPPPRVWARVAARLGLAGVTRICPLGRAQEPLPGHHDGASPLAELVRWVDLE